jgi:fatty-acyl-CoA synthase
MSHDQRRDSELPPAKSAVQTSANDVMSRDSVDHFDPTVSGSLPLNYSSEFWAPDFRTSAWKAGALDRQDVLSKRLHPTLVHALVAAAKLEGDFGVTVLPERERDAPEVMTYRELYEDARSIANGLRDLGTGRGDRILIVLPTCMDFLAVFFACQMVGAIPVPAYPPSGFRIETGLKRLAHIAQHSGSRLCVTWGTVGPLISEIAHTAKSLERVVNVPDLRGGRLPELHATRRDEPAFIQYTSGSTGNPKGVLLSHRNLITNIHGMGQALHIDHNDVLVGWCPLYHDMGLIGTFLSAVYWRLPLVLLSPSAFLTKPRRWLRAMSDYGGTISPAPNFGYALAVKRVKEADREGLDLSRWRVALNGAESVTEGVVREFQDTYAPYGFRATAMFPVYGLAESSLAVSFPDLGTPVRYMTVDRARLADGVAVQVAADAPSGTTLTCVGRAIPGHSVRVVSDQNSEVGEDIVGHVIVTGDSVMNGYFMNPGATEDCLRQGWLWTGDLGFVSGGELYLCGRAKDLIIVRGKNYHAEDLEQCAEDVVGVRRGAVVAFGVFDEQAATDRVIVVAETKEEDEAARQLIAQRVSEAVVEGTGLPVDEVVMVSPSTIPKTSSGKRQRQACKLQYLNGTLRAHREGKLALGMAFVRSQAGAVRMGTRRLRRLLTDD